MTTFAHCPICDKYYPSRYGNFDQTTEGTMTFVGNTEPCPEGHRMTQVSGTYTVKNGIVLAINGDPDLAAKIKEIATRGIADNPEAALAEIQKLVPAISPTIKEQFGSLTAFQILSLLLDFIGLAFIAYNALKTNPPANITINNYNSVINNAAPESSKDKVIPQALTKEQVRKGKQVEKKKMKKKKRRDKSRKNKMVVK